MTITTLEPVTAESLDWRPPCEFFECDNAATHIQTWNCHSILLCVESIKRQREDVRIWGPDLRCHKCKRIFSSDEVRTEPLP